MIIQPTTKSLQKAFKDDYISEDTFTSMKTMMKSNSPDDVILSSNILKHELQRTLTANLNEEQKHAFKNMIEYIYDPSPDLRACLLNGSAGTGKTTVVTKLIYAVSILSPKEEINVNAPTHKAIKLLEDKCTDVYNTGQIKFTTTHSTLNLRRIVDSNGKVKFKGRPGSLNHLHLMVVDEVSMIEDDLFKIILDNKSHRKTRIILLGDRKQLPPVNSKDSYIFTNAKNHNVYQMNLTKIVRQVEGNPIVKLTKLIGDNVDKLTPINLQQDINDSGDGVIIRSMEQLDNILNYWVNLQEYKDNLNTLRILAWTNAMVNKLNLKVRNIMFNNPSETYVSGERIIAREPLFNGLRQIADNSDEFTVKDINIIQLKKNVPVSLEKLDLYFYQINTLEMDYPILRIHEDSLPLYETKLDDLKNYCMRKQDPKIWSKYYEMVSWNANINYSYAGTVHTSQGSTYQNAIVMLKDILNNKNFVERNKLLYTAFTRAKKKLIIVN